VYDLVIWPEQYDPKVSPIYALNDIDVNAPPEMVWKLLVDARNWSSYCPPENQVKMLTREPELALGTKFSRVAIGFLMFPRDGVRALPQARVVDDSRRRQNWFDRLPLTKYENI
jgi:hypothetical protein